jgi:hypothetical protein
MTAALTAVGSHLGCMKRDSQYVVYLARSGHHKILDEEPDSIHRIAFISLTPALSTTYLL